MAPGKMSDGLTANPTEYSGLLEPGVPASYAKRRRGGAPQGAENEVYGGHELGAATYPSKNRGSGPSWIKAIWYRFTSAAQKFCLQHPNILTKFLLLVFYALDAVEAAAEEAKKPGEGGPYVCWQRAKVLGPSFCVFGQVLTGELAKVQEWILEPQQRASTIAWIRMVKSRFAHEFLLFLSDKAVGGDGLREKVKMLLVNEIFGADSLKKRAADNFVKQMLADFAPIAAKETRAYNNKEVLMERELFAIKYINYVILGVKLSTKDAEDASKYRSAYTASRLWPFGYLRSAGPTAVEKKIAAIYMDAPALQGINYGKYNLTKDQVVSALQPIFGVAAMPAIVNFVNYILNFTPPDAQLDTRDKETFGRNFTLEMLRMHTPVATVNVVKKDAFEVKMGKKMEKFPAGTTVGLNMFLSMHDAKYFPDPMSFDISRAPILSKESTSFHSVGDKNFGRNCPAQKLMENFAGDFIESLKNAGWMPNNSPEWFHY